MVNGFCASSYGMTKYPGVFLIKCWN